MKKRNLFVVTLILLLAFSLSGCGGSNDSVKDNPKTDDNETSVVQAAEEETTTPETTTVDADAEWRQFLNDYEKWYDDYVAFLKKYEQNPTDASLLNDYTKMMEELVEWSEKAEKIEADLANDPEALKEFTEANLRIMEKLGSV